MGAFQVAHWPLRSGTVVCPRFDAVSSQLLMATLWGNVNR